MSINSSQRALGPEDGPGKRVLSLHSGYFCSLVCGMVSMQRQAHCFGVDQSPRRQPDWRREGHQGTGGGGGGRCLLRASL